MVDVYARLDTAHGDGGAQIPRQAPHLYGQTIEDVEPLPTSSRVDSNVAQGMPPDVNLDEVPAEGEADADEETSEALLSKTALRKMSAEDLAAYASDHNVDPEGATKEEIIAALYGE